MITKRSVAAMLFLLIGVQLQATNNEPIHEFDRPGYNEKHGYDGIIPQENIDLFTGGLLLSQRDIPVKDNKAYEEFQLFLTRYYSNKVYRQEPGQQTCDASGFTIDDEFIGLGWTLHFGRLWDYDTDHPVLELPDGTRHSFFVDSEFLPDWGMRRMMSKSLWTLNDGSDETLGDVHYYEATSPGPDVIKMRFYDYPDQHTQDCIGSTLQGCSGGRKRLHADLWMTFCPAGNQICAHVGERLQITYARDTGNPGKLWPIYIYEPCQKSYKQIQFIWAMGPKPKLTEIKFPWIGGQYVSYFYTYKSVPGHDLLETVKTPMGRTYKYEYTNKELTAITVSTDPQIGSDDLRIEYTYSGPNFTSPPFLTATCTRAISTKKVYKPDGTFDQWSYEYANNPHKATVKEPLGRKREAIFQGYNNTSETWFVGTQTSDEIFDQCDPSYVTCTSLRRTDNLFSENVLSNTDDPDTPQVFESYVKTAKKDQSTVTYPQTGQSSVTVYSGYDDRYGNPTLVQEKDFNGNIFRKTEYTYKHATDANFKTENFIHAVASEKVSDPTLPLGSQIVSARYTHTIRQ